jgi:hypothetical protein
MEDIGLLTDHEIESLTDQEVETLIEKMINIEHHSSKKKSRRWTKKGRELSTSWTK